jgi:hypothetical protein
MSGGSYFEFEWTVAESTWAFSEDVGSGLVSRGTVTLAAGTRTTTGHLAALVEALNAAAGVVATYTLTPWAAAPQDERPSQRWAITGTWSSSLAWRLASPTGSAALLGLAGTSDSVSKVIAPNTWVKGIWAPPMRSFADDRRYQKNRQSFTQIYNRAPLIIRHTNKVCRNFRFTYLPGRWVRGAGSPNADGAQVGVQGTFEDLWIALSTGLNVYYWSVFDDSAPPTGLTGSVKIAMESADQAASLLECLDDSAWASFGRDAHHVMFEALEVGT